MFCAFCIRCDVAESPCTRREGNCNNGICMEVPAPGMDEPIISYCVCEAGWTGADCDVDISTYLNIPSYGIMISIPFY